MRARQRKVLRRAEITREVTASDSSDCQGRQEPVPRSPGAIAGNYVLKSIGKYGYGPIPPHPSRHICDITRCATALDRAIFSGVDFPRNIATTKRSRLYCTARLNPKKIALEPTPDTV